MTQRILLVASVLCLAFVDTSHATIPYSNMGPFVSGLGPGLPTPPMVPGKEYSHDLDLTALPPGGGLDPAQVLAWDGFGGTADGLDYSAPAPIFASDGVFQVDAIAHSRDLLFQQVLEDVTPMVFSVDDMSATTIAFGLMPTTVPSAGPLPTTGGNLIGGAGEVSYELPGAPFQSVWAPQPIVNGMPLPVDVDGLEVWGPEPMTAPNFDASGFGDADKYSVDVDFSTGAIGGTPPFSVWSYPAQTGYVLHSTVLELVSTLLGPDGGFVDEPQVNLDALMVLDTEGVDGRFDPGDRIIFSIEQIPTTAAPDGSGFFATGSELFFLDGASMPGAPVGGYVVHGGHIWDKAYALSSMVTSVMLPTGAMVDVQLDINAIEAIGVPEPQWGGGVLLLLLAACRRRQ
ncbi:MAG: hypothetical protein AAGF97_02295 [Planctomycetota bacterium]